MPERERAQERPQRRGRHHPVPQHPLRLAAAQHIGIVDRVAAHQRRKDERQQLATRPSRPRPLTQIKRLVHDLLDPEPPGQRARQNKARVRDRALVVEGKREPVDTLPATPIRTPPSRHHTDDLLSAGLAAAYTARLACPGGHFRSRPGQRSPRITVDRGLAHGEQSTTLMALIRRCSAQHPGRLRGRRGCVSMGMARPRL